MKRAAESRRVHLRSLKGLAALAYKCVRLATDKGDALVLAFDAEGEHSIRQGVAAAKGSAEEVIPTIVAEASPEFEAWVIAGHELTSTHHRERHQEALERLKRYGIDPLEKPHKLTANVSGDARDSKEILALLLGIEGQPAGTPEVSACLDADLTKLRSRGRETGIAQYLDEVAAVMIPLLRSP